MKILKRLLNGPRQAEQANSKKGGPLVYEELIYECETKIRISHDDSNSDFADEIRGLIEAALKDLQKAGIRKTDIEDPLIRQAVKTYVAKNFGNPDNYDQLNDAYNSQKGSLQTYHDYK